MYAREEVIGATKFTITVGVAGNVVIIFVKHIITLVNGLSHREKR